MTLCNQLVMRTADRRSRRALRDAMRRAGVEDAAAKALDRAAAAFGGDESGDDDGYDEDLAGWLPLDAAGGVEPLRGRMRGELRATKRLDAARAALLALLGSDRGVKSRSYCLDAGLLTWEGGRTLDESKFVRIDDVQAVRSCSDNAGINAVARLAVELVFEPPRPPLVLGTDDDRAHSAWVVALRVAKRTAAADATALTAAGAPPGSPARRRKRRKSALSAEERTAAHGALKKQVDIFFAVKDADAGDEDVKNDVLDALLKLPGDQWRGALANIQAYEGPAADGAPRSPRSPVVATAVVDTLDAASQTDPVAFGGAAPAAAAPAAAAPAAPAATPAPAGGGGEASGPPVGEDPKYKKYFKMLAMHLPRGAVEQKMVAEGVDVKILDLDPTKPMPGAGGEASGPPVGEDPKYKKYFKMLAMHLPRGAVEQKMMAEGMDPKILDLDPTKPMPGAGGGEAAGPPVGEDPKYKKYFKMLAMHLPRGAVEQKMMAEGVDVKILDLDPTKPMPGAGGGEAAGPPVGEDPKYKKYFKMLAMHLPRGAVEQKMIAEGMDPKILDLDPTKPMPGAGGGEPSGPPVGDDPRYKKYFKMLAMHLPRGAVEQKMIAEGMDPKILDLDPTKPAPAAAAPSGPPVGEDPKYAKYFKMLKMHLPRGAVEQKMIAEGMDPKVLDLDPTKPAPAAAAPSGPPVGEDPKYAKYFKMLKMHLPRGAVEQKMIAEGMDPKVLDLDPTKPAPAAAAGGGVKSVVKRGLAAKKAAQKPKLKALFWTKLGGDDAAGTVWGDFPKEAATGAPTVAAIERLFGKKPAKKKEAAGEEKKSKGVQLVDGKRNQNVLIGLGRVKLSHAGIRDAIVGLDFTALPQLETAGGVEVFLTLVPEPEEVAEVGRYIRGFGDKAAALASLAPVEHFFAVVGAAPRLRPRLAALLDLWRFEDACDAVAAKVAAVAAGAKQMQAAGDAKSRLCAALRVAVAVGNVLNRDTARGDARGFRPDMLPKLATIKCNDPKDGTLVDVITNALDEASVVGLERDLDAVPSAAAVDGKELDGDLKALEKTLSKSIEVELKAAEAASDAGAKPFAKLVRPLGAAARKRCDATAADLAKAVAASKAAMARFGAVPPADGADPSKAFYANAAKDEAKAAAKRDRAAKKGGAPSPPASPAGGDLQADLRNALRAPRLRKAKPRPPPGAGAKPTWQQKATASAAPKDDILAAFKQRQDMSAADIVKDWVR
ncbi:hypothetical protein JL721_739 [Aureococcus anophagefferens]|nr:hypothetical protein JL721_739 [Aureococcus anophagefferens]